MKRTPREFTAAPAVRQAVPVLVGLVGPSGGGKTFSALRLAKGIQRVDPGPIFLVDSENGRALHYAERFRAPDGSPGFYHVPFTPPFGSLDYLDVLRFCISQGARTIVVDSTSHEHEGPGGLLDLHETELERMAGDDYRRRESMKMLAWAKPKANRRALLNELSRMGVNVILCFRAKETAKPVKVNGKTEVVPQGFVPIGGDEFVFEMTLNALLLPGSGGVPTWSSENPGERMAIKVPDQFKALLRDDPKPLDEELGERLAKWARAGSAAPKLDPSAGPADPVRAAIDAESADPGPVDHGGGEAPEDRKRAELERLHQTQSGGSGLKGDPHDQAGPVARAVLGEQERPAADPTALPCDTCNAKAGQPCEPHCSAEMDSAEDDERGGDPQGERAEVEQPRERLELERVDPVPPAVYALADEAPNFQGLRAVYRDGVLVGGVEVDQDVREYSSHEAAERSVSTAKAQREEAAAAPQIRPNPEDRQPPADEDAFSAFAEVLVEAEAWPDVRAGYLALLKTAGFKAAGGDVQAKARAAAYRRQRELLAYQKDRTDLLDCPHLFRCYLDAEHDPAAIEGNARAFFAGQAFTGLPEAAQAAFRGAVSTRLAALQSGAFA